MVKIEFSLLSLSHSTDMSFEATKSIDEFVNNFQLIFAEEKDIDFENRKIHIKSPQQNTPILRERVNEFIENFKDLDIRIFKLRDYFKKLKEGEYFIIFNRESMTTEQQNQKIKSLISLKTGISVEEMQKQMDEFFGELLKTYAIQPFDGKTKISIGEPIKSKRVCRFCNNNRENVSFKKKAHAISESLGNKKIILNEECDECNIKFGLPPGIENSLITFLKFCSVFFGIKGSNGIPEIKGKNFGMSNKERIEIKYNNIDDDNDLVKEESFIKMKARLDTFDNIVMQGIYKTLCKYLLSVVDSSILPKFQNTIDWINGNVSITKLPKVKVLSSYDSFNKHPSLVVYLRQDENTVLPYAVGELHYVFMTFVFIVPLTTSDDKDFTDRDDFDIYWNFFKHYSKKNGWIIWDFSDNIKQRASFNLSFNSKRSKDESTNT